MSLFSLGNKDINNIIMLLLSLLEIIYVVHSRGSQYPEILSVQVFILYTPNVILVVDHDEVPMLYDL